MRRSNNVNHLEQTARAVLKLAAEVGYDRITPDAVAKLIGSNQKIKDKSVLIKTVFDWIDQQVVERLDQIESEAEQNQNSRHDYLFEMMMVRFDILQDQRLGVIALFDGLKKDPCTMKVILPSLFKSMARLTRWATSTPWHRPGYAFGLGLIYLAVLRVWRDDDSEDMAVTMAELDRRLTQSGRWVNWIADKINQRRPSMGRSA